MSLLFRSLFPIQTAIYEEEEKKKDKADTSGTNITGVNKSVPDFPTNKPWAVKQDVLCNTHCFY